jgi:hypothetical protein
VAGVSQQNYMAATGSQATGVGVKVTAAGMFSKAPSWLELQESMGANCGGKSTFYKRGHDPAYWYTPIAAQCKVNDIPAATSASGLASIPNPLPARSSPNLCHNNHWLRGAPRRTQAQRTCGRWTRGSGNLQTIANTTSWAGRTLVLIVSTVERELRSSQ